MIEHHSEGYRDKRSVKIVFPVVTRAYSLDEGQKGTYHRNSFIEQTTTLDEEIECCSPYLVHTEKKKIKLKAPSVFFSCEPLLTINFF